MAVQVPTVNRRSFRDDSPPTDEVMPDPTWAERASASLIQIGASAVVLIVVFSNSFELDRFYIPKELVLHVTAVLAGLLALGSIKRMESTRLDGLLAGFIFLSGLSMLFAANFWAGHRAFGITVSGIVLFWTARGLRQAGLAPAVLKGLAIGLAVAALPALAQAFGLETAFFSENRIPGGTLGNRNSVAHLMVLGLPILLYLSIRATTARGFMQTALGIMLATDALVLTRSRAAWLGVAAMLSVFFVGLLLAPTVRRKARVWARLGMVLLFIAIGGALAIFVPNALRWNSDSPYLETARRVVDYRDGSGRGRLVQYRQSLKMAAYHPLLGVGPGNWPVDYPEYAVRGDPSLNPSRQGMTMNPWPSSDWVALISERGLFAFVFFMVILFRMAWSAWKTVRSEDEPAEGLAAICLLSSIAAIGAVGMFDAVTLLAWPTFFFWVAAGCLWNPETSRRVLPRSFARLVVVMACLILSGTGAVRSAGQIAAMQVYDANGPVASLERGARFDPGNYRLRVRLARRIRGDKQKRCEHATAAHYLFPNASEAKILAARCD